MFTDEIKTELKQKLNTLLNQRVVLTIMMTINKDTEKIGKQTYLKKIEQFLKEQTNDFIIAEKISNKNRSWYYAIATPKQNNNKINVCKYKLGIIKTKSLKTSYKINTQTTEEKERVIFKYLTNKENKNEIIIFAKQKTKEKIFTLEDIINRAFKTDDLKPYTETERIYFNQQLFNKSNKSNYKIKTRFTFQANTRKLHIARNSKIEIQNKMERAKIF